MDIRAHRPSDIPDISKIYFNTIHRVNSRDYSPTQIQAWAPTIFSNSYWSDRFQKRRVLVAEDKNKIVGFAEYKNNGHVDCFYVHHEHQKRGIGSALISNIEEELFNLNIQRIFAEVSLTARNFFLNKGFRLVEERISEYNNVEFKQFLMEKYLRQKSSGQMRD